MPEASNVIAPDAAFVGAESGHAPTATVVVLGFNGRAYVDACLSSLLDQDEGTPSFEVLFFDNASSDGTPQHVADVYPSVRLVRSSRNLGYAAGNVAALKYVRSRYVVFLNQDTVVSRKWLKAMVCAAVDTGAAAVHGNMILPWQPCYAAFERRSDHDHLHVAELTRAAYVRYTVRHGPRVLPTLFVSGACFLIDQGVLARIGGLFEPDFWAYCEDTDLALRLRAAGLEVVLAGDAPFIHDLSTDETISRRAIAKTLRILRNRHLACIRSMRTMEYVRLLPVLVAGAAGKADERLVGGRLMLAIRLGMMVLSALGLLWAIASLPRHRAARARTLAMRVGGPSAIADALSAAENDPATADQGPRG